MKANSNQAVLKTLARLGAGMDVVSEGELRRARAAGTPAKGSSSPASARRAAEMALGLRRGHPLLQRRDRSPNSRCFPRSRPRSGKRAPIAIRVNPDVDARTHAKISTGKSENKFGVPISRAREVYARAAKLPGIEVDGVDMHIGSQITDLQPFDDAFALLAEFVPNCAPTASGSTMSISAAGSACPTGFDNDPPPPPSAYAEIVATRDAGLDCELVFEPGRLIVGNAGVLVTSVLYVKRGENKNFVIVDAAMNDLVRPTLYEAHHEIRPLRKAALDAPRFIADVVGPVCESGDYLALGSRDAGPASRRPARRADRRRLWRGAGRHLQHPTARPGGSGQRRRICCGSPAADL